METVEQIINGKRFRIADEITFTPYFAFKRCPARCRFCSETLKHRNAICAPATLKHTNNYFEQLETTLHELRGVRMGYSLSGLEVSADPRKLEHLLEILDKHAQHNVITDKVMYTNGAGFTNEEEIADLLKSIEHFGMTRIELSRHHFDEAANQSIMVFEPDWEISENKAFEQSVHILQKRAPPRLVCIVQKGGIDTVEKMEEYIQWAQALGVRSIVFREFARLDDNYQENRTYRYIKERAIPVETFADTVLEDEAMWQLVNEKQGYYYQKKTFDWNNTMEIIFEYSDYAKMNKKHNSDTIHKFVFHPNGNLTAGWDAGKNIIMSGVGNEQLITTK